MRRGFPPTEPPDVEAALLPGIIALGIDPDDAVDGDFTAEGIVLVEFELFDFLGPKIRLNKPGFLGASAAEGTVVGEFIAGGLERSLPNRRAPNQCFSLGGSVGRVGAAPGPIGIIGTALSDRGLARGSFDS